VAINEAVELAKDFGADGGHTYVNGVLDRLAKNTRHAERG
jgi:N utilization substance protein B